LKFEPHQPFFAPFFSKKKTMEKPELVDPVDIDINDQSIVDWTASGCLVFDWGKSMANAGMADRERT
jgi:hypothetical protein